MYDRDNEIYRPRDFPPVRRMFDGEGIPESDQEARIQFLSAHLKLPDYEVSAIRDEAGNAAQTLNVLEDRTAEEFRVAQINAAAKDDR